jgi:hypothetical protein
LFGPVTRVLSSGSADDMLITRLSSVVSRPLEHPRSSLPNLHRPPPFPIPSPLSVSPIPPFLPFTDSHHQTTTAPLIPHSSSSPPDIQISPLSSLLLPTPPQLPNYNHFLIPPTTAFLLLPRTHVPRLSRCGHGPVAWLAYGFIPYGGGRGRSRSEVERRLLGGVGCGRRVGMLRLAGLEV